MCDYFYAFVFFFSSRRRHTRLQGDWSSDVCSSDLCSRSIGDPPRPVSGSVTLDPSSIKRYAGTAMRWLMLLMSLPPTPTRHRVGVWRKLQRMGAVRLRGSAWILPETPETTELFQWLVQENQSFRREAPLVHRHPIPALTEGQ